MPGFRSSRPVSALGLIFCLALVATPAQALRILDYNCLNFGATASEIGLRVPAMRTIISQMHPDILVVQEMNSDSTNSPGYLFSQVMEVIYPGEYAVAKYVKGPDTNSALLFRTAAVSVPDLVVVPTTLRDIDRWHIRPVGYGPNAEFWIYSAHLKASTGSTNEAQRLAEVTNFRNNASTLPSGAHILFCGDFNMQSSSEAAWGKLTVSEANDIGRMKDPINQVGTWHDNTTFRFVWTQSPRTVAHGGGSTGGIDDRFDWQLISYPLQDGQGMDILTSTYKCYGNDGNHWNLAINAAPTIPEGATIANALEAASDHMPVVADYQLWSISPALAAVNFGSVLVGATAAQNLPVSNLAALPADGLTYTLSATAGFIAPAGTFEAAAAAAANNHALGMNTSVVGVKNGTLTLSSDDVDNPTRTAALTGTVLAHAVPSTDATALALLDTLDFGSHALGGFSDQTGLGANLGYQALQAQAELYQAGIGGPDAARFSLVGGFTPALVGGTPMNLPVHFDDTGAAGGNTYTATLVVKARDLQALPGALELDSLTYFLTASVSGTSGTEGALPTLTALLPNRPNPFSGSTRLRFALAQGGPVRLSVYDISGRLVRSLVDGARFRGNHDVTWDGRDGSGRSLGAGVYFYRLEAGGRLHTRPMVLLN